MTRPAKAEPHPASFRDPSGFLFRRDGRLFRQVNRTYAEQYEALKSSGLYGRLVELRRLLPHSEVNEPPARPEQAYRVLEPVALDFVSYPFEWSFSQLKDAALLTLDVQRIALRHGMSLKDASAYNVQFQDGTPILVDSLSFDRLQPSEPWLGYRQFCQHFLAPLALMSSREVRLGQLLRSNLDGLPLDLISRLLPTRTWLSPGMLVHLHLHAAAQRRYQGRPVSGGSPSGRWMGLHALAGLVDSLERAVKRLRWDPGKSGWAAYDQIHQYSPSALQAKERLTDEFLERVRPATVWDLGANIGRFSRRASRRGIFAVAFDFDPGAVELNYRRVKEEQEGKLLPLLLDLTNPSPGLGWAGRERMSLAERGPAGALFVLALVHHLAISNNLPLTMLAEYLASLSPWLLVEYIPKTDPQVERLLLSRKDIFPEYTVEGFEKAFAQDYLIQRREPVAESGRWIYWMESRA